MIPIAILNFILSNWRYFAGGAAAIVIGLALWHLDDAIWQRGADAQAALDKPIIEALTKDRDTLKANQTVLTDGLIACNASVASFKTAADARTADAAKALAALRGASVKAATLSAQVLAMKPGADICASADALMLGSLAP